MKLDEFEQMFRKLERRLRDPRVVEVLANAELRDRHQGRFQREGQSEAGVRGAEGGARSKPSCSAKKSTRPGW